MRKNIHPNALPGHIFGQFHYFESVLTTDVAVHKLNQQEFEALFDNAAMGIITVNPHGEIVMLNDFALQQFGYKKDELIGRKIEVLVPGRFRDRHQGHRSNYQQYNPHKRPMGVGMDLWALKKDGAEFPVEVSLSTYHTPEGPFSIAFVTDITVRKASENALRQLNDELERKVEVRTQSLRDALEREKELNELKSRFVSMASHEFRTPLSTILSSAYLVSQYTSAEDEPRRDKHIERIVSSVNMLTDILNDFLSVGKIEEGKIQVRPAAISIPSWIGEVVGELEILLKPGQRIVVEHTGAEAVSLDPALLKHIVQNLVANAVKFSSGDSNISLRTVRANDSFALSVTDEGIGISEEDQVHLFERFFRAANAVNIQGTGLGLHIVAKYAELMNGTVNCRSVLGEGSTFTVTFQTDTPAI